MDSLLLLILLGLTSYLLFEKSLSKITRTPIWLLWLVMMIPALIWTWADVFLGRSLSLPVMTGLFLVCMIVYLWLIDLGKLQQIEGKETKTDTSSDSDSQKETQEVLALRPISTTEENALRNCFPWGIYYLEHIDYRPQAILCRGKLRAVPDVAYQTIKKNIEQIFGDRFVILFQEGFQGQTFFALVPNPWAKGQNQTESEPLKKPGLALSLLLITLLTTTVMGSYFSGVTAEQMQSNPALLLQGLPYSLALMLILGVHELSHYFAAVYYQIRTTLPYFIPEPFLLLGTIGAFVQMRSPVPNRRALFDVAIAGPIGGLIFTFPSLIWGLYLSKVVPISDNPSILNFDALNPRFSFLFSLLSKLTLGSDLVGKVAIDLHPLAIAGYLGLIVTAINLIPIGQLDGGHIVHAMFGQTTAVFVGQITRILVLFLAFTQPNFMVLAIILFFMPVVDQPALNDVTELNNGRDFLGLASLALLVMILLPLPPIVAEWMGF
jgi:membrane-associated protease RseP (regulator of RpoE activity)